MRNIFTIIALGTFILFLNSCGTQITSDSSSQSIQYPIAHHVFFWLNNPDNTEERTQFEKAMEELLQIPEIKAFHVGTPAPVEERPVIDGSYTYSYLIFFDNIQGHDIYQEHPLHQKFIDENRHLWAKVQVYDAQLK
jgi:hypothetical protein